MKSASSFPPNALPPSFLIRGVNWLGDAILTTPALQQLRNRFPNSPITLVTPEKLAPLWSHHPTVTDVIAIGEKEGPFALARRLRLNRWTHALIFPNSFRSAWEIFLARVPRRTGYQTQYRSWLLTEPVPIPDALANMRKRTKREIHALIRGKTSSAPRQFPPESHHLFHYLNLVAVLGADPTPVPPRLATTGQEVADALKKFRLATDPRRPLFALNPGAEYGPAKRWPADRFIAAAIQIHHATQCRWIIFGSNGDRPLADQLELAVGASISPENVCNLAGKTNLRELSLLLKSAALLLTNDTGPMHLAAAVGTPVIVPFGSTSPELTGPGLPRDPSHRILRAAAPCSPCFLRVCPIDFRCMTAISVTETVGAVLDLYRQSTATANEARQEPGTDYP